MQFRHIPISELAGRSPGADGLRHPEIVSNSDTPRYIDDACGASEEPSGEIRRADTQDFVERDRLKTRDGHALTVNGVEAGDGVSEYLGALAGNASSARSGDARSPGSVMNDRLQEGLHCG